MRRKNLWDKKDYGLVFLATMMPLIFACDWNLVNVEQQQNQGQQQQQDVDQQDSNGGGTGQPLGFDCIVATGDSSCNLSFQGGGAFDVHVICAKTPNTPAIDTVATAGVSGALVDPIQNAGGTHQCRISLEINGATQAGPVVKTFTS